MVAQINLYQQHGTVNVEFVDTFCSVNKPLPAPTSSQVKSTYKNITRNSMLLLLLLLQSFHVVSSQRACSQVATTRKVMYINFINLFNELSRPNV